MRTWTAVLLLVVMVVVVATMAEPEPMGPFSRRIRGGNGFRSGLLGFLTGISGSNPSGFLGGLFNIMQQNGTNILLTFIGQMAGCRFGESTQT